MCQRVWPLTHLVGHVYGVEVAAVQLQHVGLFQLVLLGDNLAIDPVPEHPVGGLARLGGAPGGNNTNWSLVTVTSQVHSAPLNGRRLVCRMSGVYHVRLCVALLLLFRACRSR